MNSFEDVYSFRKKFDKKEKITRKEKKFLNLNLFHKILDSVNFSLLVLIFILSFLSLNSQRQWTNIYKNLTNTRAANNNLIDYISKTEEFYINKLESLDTLKKTTPEDLIYLRKEIPMERRNFLKVKIKFIQNGLKDSFFQRGY